MNSIASTRMADAAAVLDAAPYSFLLLATDLTVIDANVAYLRAAASQRVEPAPMPPTDRYTNAPGQPQPAWLAAGSTNSV